jgi:hypothetical protein
MILLVTSITTLVRMVAKTFPVVAFLFYIVQTAIVCKYSQTCQCRSFMGDRVFCEKTVFLFLFKTGILTSNLFQGRGGMISFLIVTVVKKCFQIVVTTGVHALVVPGYSLKLLL